MSLLPPIGVYAQQATVPVTVEVLFTNEQFGSPGVGASSVSASARTSSLVFQDLVQPRPQTRREKDAARQLQTLPRTVGAFMRYERVEFDTQGVLDFDGNIYSTNLHLAWDLDNFSFGVLIPYDFLDLDSFDAHRIGTIAYGQYHFPLGRPTTLSLTVNGNHTFTAIAHRALSDVNTFGGGIGLSLTLDKDLFVGSAALSYQANVDDSGSVNNQQHLLKLGATAGVRLGASAVLTLFGSFTQDLTDYTETFTSIDKDYGDIGIEFSWSLSSTWRFTGGYKKILGLQDFDSHLVFIGTLLRF
jgi:hypothetical protein